MRDSRREWGRGSPVGPFDVALRRRGSQRKYARSLRFRPRLQRMIRRSRRARPTVDRARFASHQRSLLCSFILTLSSRRCAMRASAMMKGSPESSAVADAAHRVMPATRRTCPICCPDPLRSLHGENSRVVVTTISSRDSRDVWLPSRHTLLQKKPFAGPHGPRSAPSRHTGRDVRRRRPRPETRRFLSDKGQTGRDQISTADRVRLVVCLAKPRP
jgi:hypothetical protein